MSRIEPAGDEIVTGAFWCTFHQDRRFDFQETTLIQIVTYSLDHTMTQHYIVSHARTPQIKIAIFEPERLIYLYIIANGERRCTCRIQDHYITGSDFNSPCTQIRILCSW